MHNSQKVGTTQVSIKWCTDKQMAEHPCNTMSSAIKRNAAPRCTTMWMNPGNVTLSKGKCRMPHVVWFHLQEVSRTDTSTETESRLTVSRAQEEGERGGIANGYGPDLGDNENVPELVVNILKPTNCVLQNSEFYGTWFISQEKRNINTMKKDAGSVTAMSNKSSFISDPQLSSTYNHETATG